MAARSKGTATSGSVSAAAVQAAKSPDQLHLFESGIRLFREGNFQEARELFRKAAAGPDRGIAHRAELHARMCDRRCEKPVQVPNTVEDHYNYAVAMINVRNLEQARNHLRAALQIDLGADHVYYALALCEALSGNLSLAYDSLKTAIDLQPRNRVAARQDVDFAPFVHQTPIDRLLGTDTK